MDWVHLMKFELLHRWDVMSHQKVTSGSYKEEGGWGGGAGAGVVAALRTELFTVRSQSCSSLCIKLGNDDHWRTPLV